MYMLALFTKARLTEDLSLVGPALDNNLQMQNSDLYIFKSTTRS